MIDEHGGSDADVKARIGRARAAYLQLRNILDSKQLSTIQQRSQNFQYKCQDSSTVWGWQPGELRKPSSRRYKCLLTVVHAKYFGSVGQTLPTTTYYEREKPDLRGRRNQEAVLEADRTHIEESTGLHQKASRHL
ncbi:Laminin subunit gamma-1 [Schistosoma haematobium]|uniref:Laminin subunit gamma-1 n=1 Tax=Schistosoma haematobium TaxID=6185 RepID=A0A922S7T2_SCHHA|nr:Laminin subunit gamma-1 [Schistosoma haematobium]KAH9596914.1 Laminin subunit gamma-1 [Schistosoma haematobium]